MNKCKTRKFISEIMNLLNEAEEKVENAASGFDEGWYSGAIDAYERVISILSSETN